MLSIDHSSSLQVQFQTILPRLLYLPVRFRIKHNTKVRSQSGVQYLSEHRVPSFPYTRKKYHHAPSPPPLRFPCPMPGIITYQKQNPICACTEPPRPCGLKAISKRHGDAFKPTCRRQGADFALPLFANLHEPLLLTLLMLCIKLRHLPVPLPLLRQCVGR